LIKILSLKKLLIACFSSIAFFSFAQPLRIKNNEAGIFSVGVRTTVSLFNDSGASNFGTMSWW
jgi:hypothetical protein